MDYKLIIHNYQLNVEYFEAYRRMFRLHQVEAIQAAGMPGSTRGQIIIPCGCGKTMIQAFLHCQEMITKELEGRRAVCATGSHRLVLNRQLGDVIIDLLIRCGLRFNILWIGSDDKADTNEYYAKYANLGYSRDNSLHLTSLNTQKIEEFVATTRQSDRHLLVIATYNSIDRLKNIGTIDLTTYDEAHNIVREDFHYNIQQIKGNAIREYYFTATRKIKEDNGGMDDETFFGPILYALTPREAVERGEIAEPRIHIIRGTHYETSNIGDHAMVLRSIIEALSVHKEAVKQASIHPEKIGAQIIVRCNGIQEMKDIYFDTELRDYVHIHNTQGFAIATDVYYVNWEKVSREEFTRRMISLKNSEDALILNVRMLTEGTNLPSITGAMPLLDLGLTSLLQLFGRADRLHDEDRRRLYAGELSPGDYKNYIKPYGHLIIPVNLESITEKKEMVRIIKMYYKEYNIPVEKLVIIENDKDPSPDDLKPMVRPDLHDGKKYELGHILNVMEESIEGLLEEKRGLLYYDYKNKKSVYSKTPQERIDYMLSLLEDYNDTSTAAN